MLERGGGDGEDDGVNMQQLPKADDESIRSQRLAKRSNPSPLPRDGRTMMLLSILCCYLGRSSYNLL